MSVQKFASFVGVVLVGCILFLIVTIAGAEIYFNSPKKSEHTIKMTGTSQVNAKPDIVKINMRIEAVEKTVKAARTASSKKYNELAGKMKSEFQIKDTEIEISNNSISEDWNYVYDVKGIIQYRAVKVFQVTFSDFKKAESFYEKAVDQYDCQVDSVDYDSTKMREYKDLARKNAVIAAKEKAQNMVAAIGQNVGKALNIEEDQTNNSIWSSYYSNIKPVANSSVTANSATNNNATPKSLSSNLDISSSVIVTFELD